MPTEIREYHQVVFKPSAAVKPSGMDRMNKLTSGPRLRIYRDMADPTTLIIQDTRPSRAPEEVPWDCVSIARRKPTAAQASALVAETAQVVEEPVKEPEPVRAPEQPRVEQRPQQHQQHGKGR